MSRPTTKTDLLQAAADNWDKLNDIISSLEEAKQMVQESHEQVMALAATFSNEELFSKGVYPWVGGNTLGSYFVSDTSSHYDWATKKLKSHIKLCRFHRHWLSGKDGHLNRICPVQSLNLFCCLQTIYDRHSDIGFQLCRVLHIL